jgi:hypothetical protein
MAGRALASWTILLTAGLCGWGEPARASVDVRHENGQLSIVIDEAPLGLALVEVARQLGAELQVRGELGEVSDVALSDLPVDVALRRLVAPHGLLLRLDPAGAPGQRRIKTIHVYQQTPPEERPQRVQPTPQAPGDDDALDESEMLSRIRELLDQGDAMAVAELAGLAATSGSATTRRLAVTALSRIGSDQAIAAIELALTDEDPAVRLQAARGYASALGAAAIGRLQSMAAGEPDETMRTALDRLIEQL